MSDTMLLGILRMPFDLALSTPIAQIQYYQRGVQAADEIEKLRAELDNAQHHIEMLQAKLDAEKSCACAYDDPNEVCLPHSPLLEKARAELDRTHKQLNAAVTLLAEWCHAVDGGAGWDYWDNHYKEARWGKGILRSLIDAEIAKLEPLEGEP